MLMLETIPSGAQKEIYQFAPFDFSPRFFFLLFLIGILVDFQALKLYTPEAKTDELQYDEWME
jgi:hypothetical protein